jgi:hypothetical protein
MVKEISRYEGEFPIDEFEYVNRYFKGFDDSGPYVYLHTQTHPTIDFAQLHINVKRFSLQIGKQMRKEFELIKADLRASGVNRISGVKDGEIRDWQRLVMFLGFGVPIVVDGYHYIEMRI